MHRVSLTVSFCSSEQYDGKEHPKNDQKAVLSCVTSFDAFDFDEPGRVAMSGARVT